MQLCRVSANQVTYVLLNHCPHWVLWPFILMIAKMFGLSTGYIIYNIDYSYIDLVRAMHAGMQLYIHLLCIRHFEHIATY